MAFVKIVSAGGARLERRQHGSAVRIPAIRLQPGPHLPIGLQPGAEVRGDPLVERRQHSDLGFAGGDGVSQTAFGVSHTAVSAPPMVLPSFAQSVDLIASHDGRIQFRRRRLLDPPVLGEHGFRGKHLLHGAEQIAAVDDRIPLVDE